MRKLLRTIGFVAVLPFCSSQIAHGACPLHPVSDASLASVFRGHGVSVGSSPDMMMFASKMALDDDGAPNAYHRGLVDARPDPGLDHICNAGDVLEYRGGRLFNRYGQGGSIGALSGVDPASGVGRSLLCKRDYIAIRDASFPACGPNRLCMRWYGVAVHPRSCGYNRAHQTGCGVPILQQGSDYYLTTNILLRPGASSGSLQQSDYADATAVPFIVLPGGAALPNGWLSSAGDLAIVAANGRFAFAVVGDSGPAEKLGEGSRALLRRLAIGPTDRPDAVRTLLFPGTASRMLTHWPLEADRIEVEGRALLGRTLIENLRQCPGFESLRVR